MYGVVLMMALVTSGEVSDFGRKNNCCGGCGGGMFHGRRHGCSGGCYGGGYGGCNGGGYGGGYGGCYGGGGYGGGYGGCSGTVVPGYYPGGGGCSGTIIGGDMGSTGGMGDMGGTGGTGGTTSTEKLTAAEDARFAELTKESTAEEKKALSTMTPAQKRDFIEKIDGKPLTAEEKKKWDAFYAKGTAEQKKEWDKLTPNEKRAELKGNEETEVSSATVVVSLPAEATLKIQGVPMRATGAERTFVTPALNGGGKYTWTFEVQVMKDNQPVSWSKTVALTPGETQRVSLAMPTTLAQR